MPTKSSQHKSQSKNALKAGETKQNCYTNSSEMTIDKTQPTQLLAKTASKYGNI